MCPANIIKFIIFSFLVLQGCGFEGSRLPSSEGTLIKELGQKIAPAKEYSEFEQAIALQICQAFRSKRVNATDNLLTLTPQFELNQNNCDGLKLNDIVTASVDNESGILIFNTSTTNDFDSLIQTDVFGELKEICPTILQGLNTVNTKILSPGITKQVNFISGSYHTFIVSSAENEFVMSNKAFHVITDKNIGPEQHDTKELGMVKVIESSEKCSPIGTKTFFQELR